MAEHQRPAIPDGNERLAAAELGAAFQPGEPVLHFRRYTVLPSARQLLVDGRPIDLGGRAFDLLVVLLQSRGRIVSKADIFSHVWPSTMVEESNLRFQMASLRTALGADRDAIKTIPGRGYVLIAEPSSKAAVPPCGTDLRAGQPARVATGLDDGLAAVADRTVAIIDDDLGVREALEGLLSSAGLTTETFSSVQEFRDRRWIVPPACLILDVWLPGINGIDFNDELAREGKQPPVIFISGHADVHTSVRAMKAGAIEFLTKPVRHQELLDAIHAAIGY